MDQHTGLKSEEVTLRLEKDGYNELPTQKTKSFFSMMGSIFKEPMILLLSVAGIVYMLLGEPKDAVVLLVSIFVVIGITLHQERKTENALQALRDLSSPRALVIRNGERIRIAGREVVVDDILVLNEGDRVPADAVLLSVQNLQIDESLLTGESLPVNKSEWDGVAQKTQAGGDNTSFVFSGTLVSQGSGIAKVISTGIKTEMGKIGKTLASIEDENFPLKREITKIVKLFLIVGVLVCVALVVVEIISGKTFLMAFLSGLTLSMSMLPEEFPVVLVIFFSLGAWRISKKQVLTRNNQAIETLGAASVLCVDKTGTLTQNKMEFTSITFNCDPVYINDRNVAFTKEQTEIFEYAVLASKRHAFDPLEKEILLKYEKHVLKDKPLLENWHLQKQYNISKDLFAMSRVWKSPDTQNYIVACKGAPEAVMHLCKLNKDTQDKIMETVEKLSNNGQRVLAVARAEFTNDIFPQSQYDFNFKYLGLIGFIDPVRSSVFDAVNECYKAGIRVIMITGDYPGTAKYIAGQAGIRNNGEYLTGKDLLTLSKQELCEKIKNVNIFARIAPEQKLNIIEALKENGEIVAMTGDGVNDGPALKAAHIGMAMGERGTDVARESADLVLLNDDFASIVSAVRLGRRIYDNLQKAVSYIFSIHIPIAGVALLPSLLGMPTVLFPVHIAFLELIIDPACSTVYEAEHSESEIMNRPPRNIKSHLFEKNQIVISTLHGLVLLATVMTVFALSVYLGKGESMSRTIAFLTMISTNLALILVDLSKKSVFKEFKVHRNKAFYYISAGTVLFLMLIVSVPFLRDLFYFSEIGFFEVGIIISATTICFVFLELLKLLKLKRVY